ncbi:MAG TPA: thioredoxin domain-containing protein [Nitrospira sp.]|nr:thioredoxin domain-containing protein [Nitrospira sp.]
MAKRPSPEPDLVITARDHAQGPATAPVTLVEYGDFECPYSRDAVRTVKALQREFGPDLRFVFRHFPLTKHPHALLASEAAESAAAQGKFWPMYDLLFANQWELEYDDLLRYAGHLGLDRTVFAEDLEMHRHLDRIRADVASGRRHGVSGTPTFFVNGLRQHGDDDWPALSAAIRRALSA